MHNKKKRGLYWIGLGDEPGHGFSALWEQHVMLSSFSFLFKHCLSYLSLVHSFPHLIEMRVGG